MENIYFFVDGSALTAQIRQLQRSHAIFRNRKLCPRRYIEFCVSRLRHLVGDSYKRATFYFPKGDEVAVEEFIVVPDHAIPGEVTDLHFKFCGQKLKKSAEFAKFVDEKVPAEFEGRFQKSEKGVDTEICCDALRLAATGRLDRLFLLSNDSDFIPLCRTLKEFGSNVSILISQLLRSQIATYSEKQIATTLSPKNSSLGCSYPCQSQSQSQSQSQRTNQDRKMSTTSIFLMNSIFQSRTQRSRTRNHPI